MLVCKQALTASGCGKTICCLECGLSDKCEEICSDVEENCPDAYEAADEQDSLAVMREEAGDVIKKITDLSLEKKRIEDEEKKMRKTLLRAMEMYGVKSFENGNVKFTYVAPTVRTTIDSAKLKKDLPEIAAKYSKTGGVSAQVKITVK